MCVAASIPNHRRSLLGDTADHADDRRAGANTDDDDDDDDDNDGGGDDDDDDGGDGGGGGRPRPEGGRIAARRWETSNSLREMRPSPSASSIWNCSLLRRLRLRNLAHARTRSGNATSK